MRRFHVLGTGAAMESLEDQNLPFMQIAMVYALLFIVNGVRMAYSGWFLHAKWYAYMVIAMVDALAAFCLVQALKYTSVTSIGILSCSGVVLSIPLSYFVLKARFHFLHYAGAGLFMGGIVMLLLSRTSAETSGSHPILGDLLLISSSCLYTIDFVVMENYLKDSTPTYEFLCMISSFGLFFVLVASFIAGEYKYIVLPVTGVGLLRFGAFLALFFVYSLMPIVVTWSGSTVGQLSLLSGAIWSIPIRFLLLGGLGSVWWIFLIAVLLTVGGLLLYIIGGDVYVD